MKVLIVGGGGREHALAWKTAMSPRVSRVYVAPGNAGTALEPGVENIPVGAEDIPGLLAFAQDNSVDLTIVGPEAPLVGGISDTFAESGLRCFGPSASAARLEGSKTFSKNFLERHEIPTAEFRSFTEVEPALDYIRAKGAPIVVKADGLAAGKGVVVAQTETEAEAAARDMLGEGAFGDAGRRVVIEERLVGEEASFIAVVGGGKIVALASSQDHKARGEGDTGPNTGGMGAYSPAPVVTADMHDRIMREVMEPTVTGLEAEGCPYLGFLYAGIMITEDGTPKVLEFNCRFGDPETQPIMMRLRSDLVELCGAAIDGQLAGTEADWDPRAALGVVMAAGGYPGSYGKGDVIHGLEGASADYGKVFHAGTVLEDNRVVTSGGRVLCVVALGDTVSQAQQRAYDLAAGIEWADVYYRRDIGYRAVARE